MGRHTGPKGRMNRRLATMVYESAGAVRAYERRETPPGMYGRRKKMTTYGAAFAEKQKMKHYYGIREAQLRRYFDLARKTKGNTGQTLMLLCERRLDNVCAGPASSIRVRRPGRGSCTAISSSTAAPSRRRRSS